MTLKFTDLRFSGWRARRRVDGPSRVQDAHHLSSDSPHGITHTGRPHPQNKQKSV